MVNVIYDGNKEIRFTNYDKNITYDLTDINFFIPSDKKILVLYCVIKNSSNVIDCIKLQITNSKSKNYDCYSFSPVQLLSLNSDKFTMFLFGVYTNKSTFITDEFDMDLNVDNFKISNKLFVINELENNILNYYNKIEQLTKLNIKITNDIQNLIKDGSE